MPRLILIEGGDGAGGGQIIRTALALAVVTGQGFEMTRIRVDRLRPGLKPAHLDAVRAAAMICNGRTGGAFERSLDLRFEPGPVEAGEFQFDMGTSGAVTLVLQTVLLPLATAAKSSQVTLIGGTHLPASPSFHYLERHWLALLDRLGLRARATLERAGFYPKGGGQARVEIEAWSRPAALTLGDRGRLVGLRGLSAAGRVKGDVALRQRNAAAGLLWESRRLEVSWDSVDLLSGSPGSFVMLEAVFETGRGALTVLGERGVRAEAVGERVARALLRFLDGEGAVDPHAADQLVLPLALSGGGGLVTTTEVTPHLLAVAEVASLFGFPVHVIGRIGEPGRFEVEPH